MSRHVSLPENHDLIYHLPCGLVLLMPDFLFFLTIHVPEIFLVFVWDYGLSVKRSSSLDFIYLFLLGNINFCKKRGSIYTC